MNATTVTDAQIGELLALLRELDSRPRLNRARQGVLLALAWALGVAVGVLSGGWL